METPQQAQSGAACYYGIDDKLAAIIYLLNTGGMTPSQIQAAARCYYGIDDKLAVIVYLLANPSGGGGGTAQLVTYTSGTPANPSNTSNPAIAYDPTGNLPTLGWNTSTLTWN